MFLMDICIDIRNFGRQLKLVHDFIHHLSSRFDISIFLEEKGSDFTFVIVCDCDDPRV